MQVNFLKKVQDNPKLGRFTNRGIAEAEIVKLEQIYNGGNPFPKSLREYLFLAGDLSIFGFDIGDDIFTLNIEARETLKRQGQVIDEPFFVVAQYGGCEYIYFVRLDTNEEDPLMYEAAIYDAASGLGALLTERPITLSENILRDLDNILSGRGL